MAKNQTSSPRRLEITKYPNRRYYDRTRSIHVTLEDIRAKVRDGYEVTITDSKTKENLTSRVLAQIILELDAEKLDIFPVSLWTQVIRTNERMMSSFVDRYFSQALGAFVATQDGFEDTINAAKKLTDLNNPFVNWTFPTASNPESNQTSETKTSPEASPVEGKSEMEERLSLLEKELDLLKKAGRK